MARERTRHSGLGTRLVTERLLLRPPGEEHATAIAQALRRNAAHLAQLTPRGAPPPWSLVEVAMRVAAERRDFTRGVTFAFYAFGRQPRPREPERVLGKVMLRRATSHDREAELGYWVDAALEGRGVAHEGVREVVRFAMENADLHLLRAHVRPENVRSAALAQRLGFRATSAREADARETFVLTKEDWLFRTE
jgi:RimJ/RimL family protein N-acetyltransferase